MPFGIPKSVCNGRRSRACARTDGLARLCHMCKQLLAGSRCVRREPRLIREGVGAHARNERQRTCLNLVGPRCCRNILASLTLRQYSPFLRRMIVNSQVPRILRVLIQHSSPIVQAGLHAVLQAEAGLELMGIERFSAPLSRHDSPDVIVTDYGLAVEVWLPRRAAKCQARMEPPPRLMVVTNIDRERQIHQALAGGVDAYVAETASLSEFRHGLRQIAQGKRFVSGCFSHMLVSGLTQPELTLREQAVLTLISLGRPNKTIARDLEIASGTVKSHVRSILAKLAVTTRTEAAHVARQRGLVQFKPADSVEALVQYREMPQPWNSVPA